MIIPQEAKALDPTKNITVLPYGVIVNPKVLYDEYMEKFKEFNLIAQLSRSHLTWWLGDMIIAGEKFFPNKYEQAVDLTGYSLQYLTNCVWLATKYKLSERKYSNLSPFHYRAVASLQPEDRGAILELADAEGWTVRTVEAKVRGEDPVYTPISVEDIKIPDRPPVHLKTARVDRRLIFSLELFNSWWRTYPTKALTAKREALDKRIAKDAWEMCRHFFNKGVFDDKSKKETSKKQEAGKEVHGEVEEGRTSISVRDSQET